MCGLSVERFPVDWVYPVFKLPDLASREPVEVGSLRMPSPDETVAVLDGALLVGGKSPRVACLGLERAVEPFLA